MGGDSIGAFSQVLKHVTNLDFIPNENCNSPTLYDGRIKDIMICAGGTGQDTCSGDSGGPLILRDSKGNPSFDRVVGIVSFGPKECGQQGVPGVYTRISQLRSWIDGKIQELEGAAKPSEPRTDVPTTEGAGVQESLVPQPSPAGTNSVPEPITAQITVPEPVDTTKVDDTTLVSQLNGVSRPDPVLQPDSVLEPAPVAVESVEPTPTFGGTLANAPLNIPVEDAFLSEEQLKEKYKCPSGVPCEGTKTRKTSTGETVCQCYAWLPTGFCHPNGWALFQGEGGCDFPVNDR